MGLCLGLLLTAVIWSIVQKAEKARMEVLQQTQNKDLAKDLNSRMKGLCQVLQGAAGYLGRGPLPTRTEWRAYTDNIDLDYIYPGFQGLGFAEWIPQGSLEAHIQRIQKEGFPDYGVQPGGYLPPLPEGCSAIIYLEPMDERNQRAFGKDMLAEATRRAAMLRARDTGLAVLSGPITLFQELATDIQTGTLLYAPVYVQGMPQDTVADRRRAFRGWAYIPFRMTDLVQTTLSQNLRTADLTLFDVTDAGAPRLLFDSSPDHPRGEEPRSILDSFEVAGRRWQLRTHPNLRFYQEVGQRQHWEILAGGVLASLLLFTVLATFHGAETHSRRLAQLRGEELLATESKFRALFEKAPFGMAIVDSASGRFLSVNAHLGELLGYSPEELLTRDFQSVTHPEHLRTDLASVRDLASGLVPVIHKEKRYLHLDGHTVWGRLHLVRLPTLPEESTRLLAMVEDITEARGQEELIRVSEARWQFALDGAGDGVWDWSADSDAMFVSRGYKVMLGFGADENLRLTYDDWVERIHPEDRDTVVALADEYLQGRLPAYQAEYRLRRQDGSFICVLARGMAVARDEQGRPTRMIGTHTDITLRKKAEVALRRSEADLASAQEIGDFGSWRVAFEDEGESWTGSEGLRRIYGYGPDQPITMQTGLDMMHPEDRAFAKAAWDAAMAGTGPCEWEHRIIVGGEVRWMAVRVQFQFSPDGQLQEASGINQDITRRKATEDALRNSETRLRILSDQLPDSFLYQYSVKPGQGPQFLHLSAGVERLCGLKSDDVLRDPGLLFSTVDPAMLPAYLEAEAASARELTPFAMDLRQRHTDGHWRWFQVRSMPRPQPDGAVTWDGISTDVTERQQSRLRLEESEARFRAVIEDAPAPLFLHRNGRFVYLNPASLRLMKAHSAEDLVGQPVLDRVHPDDRAQVVERIRLALTIGAEAPLLEERFIAMDGSVLHVEALGRAVMVDGQPTILVFAQDVTARKQAEATELRAQKAESLVLMAGSIAHDFNNIFQGVLGFIEVAKIRAEQNPEIRQMLGKAEGSLRKAIGLSWKMLDFSGRALVKQERLDLEAWLPAFAATLQLELSTSLVLDVACEPIPFVMGDRARLEEVLQALVANAREAAEPLAGRVHLRLCPDFGADRRDPASPGIWPLARPEFPATVCLEVSDEGPGVSVGNLERICDPFFTTRELGRGLGLASVMGILQAHRAGLHIFNGERGGLVIRMHFPPGGA